LHIVSNTVSQLNVAASSGNTNAQINLEPTGTGIALIGPANSVAFAFRTNATEAMRLDASGNLGIGQTSPAFKLDVQVAVGGAIAVRPSTSTGNAKQSALRLYGSESVTTSRYAEVACFNDTAGSDTNALTFSTGYGATIFERARISSDGNLLVGTTSGSGKVTIKGGNGNQLYLDNAGEQFTQVTFLNNGTAKSYLWWDNTNSRLQVQSGSTGGVYLANLGTSWTSVSDERVKDIVESIENATQKLSNWRAVIGKYKTDEEGTRRSFLIAQDVLTTFPEAVDTTNNDEFGLSYQDLIPVLVKAIQEQQALITTLTARITALESA
jgi:hypothetical protein